MTDQTKLESVARHLGGQGFTPEEKADFREEYSCWSVEQLAQAFVRESFKTQLLLEIISRRVIIE